MVKEQKPKQFNEIFEKAKKYANWEYGLVQEAQKQTALAIFKEFDILIDTLKRRYEKIPLKLKVFLIDYEKVLRMFKAYSEIKKVEGEQKLWR